MLGRKNLRFDKPLRDQIQRVTLIDASFLVTVSFHKQRTKSPAWSLCFIAKQWPETHLHLCRLTETHEGVPDEVLLFLPPVQQTNNSSDSWVSANAHVFRFGHVQGLRGWGYLGLEKNIVEEQSTTEAHNHSNTRAIKQLAANW